MWQNYDVYLERNVAPLTQNYLHKELTQKETGKQVPDVEIQQRTSPVENALHRAC